MKKNIILLCLLILCSCGSKQVKEIPEHLIVGVDEMIKGNSFYQKGCYRTALERYFKAYKHFTVSDQVKNSAKVLNNIGNVYRATDKSKTALLFFKESQKIYRSLNDNNGFARASSNLAAAYISIGDLKRAESILMATIAMMGESKISDLSVKRNLAILHIKKGNFEKAEEIFSEIIKEKGKMDISSSFYFAKGDLQVAQKRFIKGIVSYEKALNRDRSTGFFYGIAQDLHKIGKAYDSLNKRKKAYFYLKRGMMVYTILGNVKKADVILKEISSYDSNERSLDLFFRDRWLKGDETPCQ